MSDQQKDSVHYNNNATGGLAVWRHPEEPTIWIGGVQHGVVYSLDSYLAALRGDADAVVNFAFCDNLHARGYDYDLIPTDFCVITAVDGTKGEQIAWKMLGVLEFDESMGGTNRVLGFARLNKTGGPSILLPFTLAAIFRVFGRMIPVDVNNRLITETTHGQLGSDDEQFVFGNYYPDNEGRYIHVQTLTPYSLQQDHPDATFGDQYGDHRRYNDSNTIGAITGGPYGYLGTIFPNNRPLGLKYEANDEFAARVKEVSKVTLMSDSGIRVMRRRSGSSSDSYIKIDGTTWVYSISDYLNVTRGRACAMRFGRSDDDFYEIGYRDSEVAGVYINDHRRYLRFKTLITFDNDALKLYAVFELNENQPNQQEKLRPWVLLPVGKNAVLADFGATFNNPVKKEIMNAFEKQETEPAVTEKLSGPQVIREIFKRRIDQKSEQVERIARKIEEALSGNDASNFVYDSISHPEGVRHTAKFIIEIDLPMLPGVAAEVASRYDSDDTQLIIGAYQSDSTGAKGDLSLTISQIVKR